MPCVLLGRMYACVYIFTYASVRSDMSLFQCVLRLHGIYVACVMTTRATHIARRITLRAALLACVSPSLRHSLPFSLSIQASHLVC
jgi:hypothetical protein